jgi:hypothetical protein
MKKLGEKKRKYSYPELAAWSLFGGAAFAGADYLIVHPSSLYPSVVGGAGIGVILFIIMVGACRIEPSHFRTPISARPSVFQIVCGLLGASGLAWGIAALDIGLALSGLAMLALSVVLYVLKLRASRRRRVSSQTSDP